MWVGALLRSMGGGGGCLQNETGKGGGGEGRRGTDGELISAEWSGRMGVWAGEAEREKREDLQNSFISAN